MKLTRRALLKSGAVAVGAMIVPSVLLRARPARAAGSDPVLVTLFLRGAADGLNLVVPHGDPGYYAARPTLAVPASSALDLDGFFGLNPSLAPLLPWYQSERLAVIHCAGSPDGTRSHFDAQDFMEFGAPGDKSLRVGWLNRFLAAAGLEDPLAAITVGSWTAKSLAGPVPSLALRSVSDLTYVGGSPHRRSALEAMYASSQDPRLNFLASRAFSITDVLKTVSTETSVTYPSTSLGQGLRELAALIKADIGVRLGAIDMGGWDHHLNEHQKLPPLAEDLAGSLAAFAEDLGPHLDRTVTIVVSEFGRRVKENGARGTDHGHGNVMLALGGPVAGGRVVLRDGTWPGLQPPALFEGIDLPVTTDYRDLFGELLTRHMGLAAANANGIFPGYTLDPDRVPGVIG